MTDRQKAQWAVAHCLETRRRYLNPELRKAYRCAVLDGDVHPDAMRDGMRAALRAALDIVASLERGLELLG